MGVIPQDLPNVPPGRHRQGVEWRLQPPFSVAGRFLESATRHAERTAILRHGLPSVSYASLANRVACVRSLLRAAGVRAGEVVAVAIGEECMEWIPSLLGVLAEGATYLALDLRLPAARIRNLIEDSTADKVLCGPSAHGCVAAWELADVTLIRGDPEIRDRESHPVVPCSENAVAFLTYTSGSTGAPKGIAIRHVNILHEVAVHSATLSLGPEDRLTALYPPSTVGSTRDLYAALLTGASLAFFPFRELGLAALRDWIRDQRLTRYHSVPPIFRELMQEMGPTEVLPDLRTVFLAGDRVAWSDVDLFRRHTASGCQFYTGIGTSETSSLYCHGFVDPDEPREGGVLPSGKPVPGVTVRLLDASGNPVPDGEAGEIVVEGRFLTAGYWRHELKAPEPFPEAPRTPGERRFRTGDFARRDGAGRLLFEGRRDQQVKIFGHRVDLSEVDLQLRRLPGVREVAVRLYGAEVTGGVPQLAAFVSWSGEAPRPEAVRLQLSAQLPTAAIPGRFFWIHEFPRLANGKLDARALDRLAADAPAASEGRNTAAVSPQSPAQQLMARLWCATLGITECGIHDSFFALGGNSLLAMRLVSRIRQAFTGTASLRMLLAAPTISGLLRQMDEAEPRASVAASPETSDAIPVVPREPPPPASHAQERLWFLNALEPGQTAYLMSEAVRCTGPLDVRALGEALRQVVTRHESLRTVFAESPEGLRQVIQAAPESVLDIEDLTGLTASDREARVAAIRAAVLAAPFDLSAGPLYRFCLLRIGPTEHLLLRAIHHIVADGWSLGVLHRELATLYEAAIARRPSPLPDLTHQFADLAVWQRRRLEGPAMEALLDHWMEQLRGAPPLLELPRDGDAGARSGGARNRHRTLPARLADTVASRARSLDATPFMVLLGTFQVLLSRLSGQEDVVVGTPVAGRGRLEAEPLIGYFINTVVLRTRLHGVSSFRELIQQVRETVLDAQEHQDLPFERLVSRMGAVRGTGRHPVFQVFFNLLNHEDTGVRLPGLDCTPEPESATQAKFDLTLYGVLRSGFLGLKARYDPDRFHESTVERLLAQYEQLLEAFVANPEVALDVPSLTLPGDLAVLPKPAAPLAAPLQPAIHAGFEEVARRSPGRLAICEPGREWTYGELEAAADSVAVRLQAAGVQRAATIGLVAAPSGWLVAGLLGILKAGGRFLVLDASQPTERLRRMVARARPVALLVSANCGDLDAWRESLVMGETPVLALSVDPVRGGASGRDVPQVTGDDAAYLVFTSGTTGKPLGILGNHGPVSHFLAWQRQCFDLRPDDRFSLLSGLGHDPLLRDLFAPLSLGASIHVPPPGVRDSPDALPAWFQSEGITVCHLTPPLAAVLGGADPEASPRMGALRWVFLGGDRLTAACVRQIRRSAPEAGIVNFYGTTETPQAMGYHVVCAPGLEAGELRDPIPIGRAIPDVQLLVWTRGGRLAGIGEPGEILVRTPFLASGYLGDEADVRVRFAPNPATGDGADRVHATGDLGRFRSDGTLEFLGRREGYLKVRGYRIDAVEVCDAIRTLPAVQDAAVVPARDGGSLEAWLVLRRDARLPGRGAVCQHLRSLLPAAAIPARFRVIHSLPLTPNGKLDFRALPELPFREVVGEATADARTGMECQVLDVWRRVLDQPNAGVHDNFFDLGGHSLLALRLLTALRGRGWRRITLAELFAHPTAGAIASLLEEVPAGGKPPRPSGPGHLRNALRGAASGVPWIHVPGIMGYEFLPPPMAAVIGRHRPIHDGLQFPGADGLGEPLRSVPELAAVLIPQIEAVCPAGPIWLSGYSMGGLVAHELARQLVLRKRRVDRVVLFDVRYIQEARRLRAAERVRLIADHLRGRRWAGRVRWARGIAVAKAQKQVRRLRRRLGMEGRTDADRMEAAGWSAVAAHRPRPYAGAVTLLRATRLGEFDTGRLERDRWNGWGPWAHSGFEVLDLDCDHASVFLEPIAPAVLDALEALILRHPHTEAGT